MSLMNLGHDIRVRRKSLKVSQKALGKEVGVSTPTIGRIESGAVTHSDVLMRIAKALSMALVINGLAE